jgi:DNA-binding transcriptional LysR family regulator
LLRERRNLPLHRNSARSIGENIKLEKLYYLIYSFEIMMNISFRQLRAAMAVADQGSFTRAADSLHLTQSACSGLVRDLETGLGVRLFDRTTRRVAMTSAGREFIAAARQSIADLDDAVGDVQALAARRRGRVTVAAPPLLAATVLPAVIRDFGSDNAAIQIVLQDVATDQIVSRVRDGSADLGVGTFDPAEDGVSLSVLTTDRLRLFCPPDHPLAKRKTVSWGALRGEALIGLTRASDVRRLTEQALAAAGLPVRPSFEVTQMATAVAMVDAGAGLAALPAYALSYTKLFRVVSRQLSKPDVTRDISLLTAKERSLSPAAAAFTEILSDRLASP